MKHVYILTLIAFSFATYLFLTAGMERSSGSPGGKTGSPGDNGSTCTQCHSGTPTKVDDLISSNIPNGGFEAGETYTITAKISNDEAVLMGFELTAENNQGNKMGSFTVTDDIETQLTNDADAVTHTSDGTDPENNANSWSMEWTAPDEPNSEVTFYAAFNAANGDGSSSGDNIFTSEQSAELSSVGIAALEIISRIYPNPAKEFLTIEFRQAKPRKIDVIDTRGAVVKSFETDQKKHQLPVSKLNKGVYFLKEGSASLKRFIVL